MSGRIAFLQHSASDVPGRLGDLARDAGLEVLVHRPDLGPDGLPGPTTFDLLVVMGSVRSVTDPSVPWIEPERRLVASSLELGTPVLGVCFGGQLLAQLLGGSVARADRPEVGWGTVDTTGAHRIGAGPWLNWHDDAFTCPPSAEPVATSGVCLQAFVAGAHTGVQFHPEVTPTVVHGWIDEARSGSGVAEKTVRALLAGFDADGRAPAGQTDALFAGFLDRAGAAAEAPLTWGGADPGRPARKGRRGAVAHRLPRGLLLALDTYECQRSRRNT